MVLKEAAFPIRNPGTHRLHSPIASRKATVALDAMGGDDAPGIVLEGALVAARRHPSLRFLIFGPQSELEKALAGLTDLESVSEIRHAPSQVSSDQRPKDAMRIPDSSMRLAIDAVRDGEADAVVSAGNTGALMSIAYLRLRPMKPIRRPAMISHVPNAQSETVILDLGANLECDAEVLMQFAAMGNIYSQVVLGNRNPRYALLNIGSGDQKGHEYLQEAARQLKELEQNSENPLPGEFIGFVEGDAFHSGETDVIITDGFTGNIAVKTMEGTVRFMRSFLEASIRSSAMASVGYLLARSTIQKASYRMDPRLHNGAMLLGLKGVTVKSHGGTDAFGFSNAVSVAFDAVQVEINKKIAGQIEQMERFMAALAD